MDDSSLDEFIEDTDSEEADEGVSPGAVISHVAPEGEACGECGETVTRLWTDDGQSVCQSCKEW